MKEMRLFEVGLKESPQDKFYAEKVNVAANDADEAVFIVRQWAIESVDDWWNNGDGMEEMIFAAYAEDKNASEEMPEEEILETRKYQKAAHKDYKTMMNRASNLVLAKVLDIGTLIV